MWYAYVNPESASHVFVYDQNEDEKSGRLELDLVFY